MSSVLIALALLQAAVKEPTPKEIGEKAIEKTRGEASYHATFKITIDTFVAEGEIVWVKEGVLYIDERVTGLPGGRRIVRVGDEVFSHDDLRGWETAAEAGLDREAKGAKHPDLLLAALSKRLAGAKSKKGGVDVTLGEDDLKAILKELGESGVEEKEASASLDIDGQGRISKVSVAAGKKFSADVTVASYNQVRALAFTLKAQAVPLDDAILKKIKAIEAKK